MLSYKKHFSENFTNVLLDEPMSKHTTFRVGGNTDVLFMPSNVDELTRGMNIIRENHIPYLVIGNGSNLLVNDNGYKGIIIDTSKYFDEIQVIDNIMVASSGVTLAKLSRKALNNSLSGLEFASGIPGTVGGAIYMNAGAYGSEIKDIIIEATVMESNGDIVVKTKEMLNLEYRRSSITDTNGIILSGKFQLAHGNFEEIKAKSDELLFLRNSKQPVDMPSAGSTFKRPVGLFAGKLIMDSGLSGYKIGGAMVSPKHCGFVVNDGSASASDILNLIEHIQKTVLDKFGVELESEVKII